MAPHIDHDPDDLFSDTRMSFGDHLEDLRHHLIKAAIGFSIGMVIALFFLGKPVMNIISAPVERELFAYWKRTAAKRDGDMDRWLNRDTPVIRFTQNVYLPALLPALREHLGLADAGGAAKEPPLTEGLILTAERLLHDLEADHLLEKDKSPKNHWVEVPVRMPDPRAFIAALGQMKPYFDPPLLRTLAVTEAFMVYFKVSLVTGLVISSPWVFYQVWAFVAAGLYPQEKKLVHVYMPFSLGLFIAGVVLCQVFVIPKAIEALLWFNEWLGFQPDLRLSDWLGFAIMMPVVFGISFQTPLVMTFLNKIGILEVAVFRKHRRIAWFLMAVFAAVITPTVDPISMLLLWFPMGLLYELGIWICARQSEAREPFEAARSEELVEV